MRLRESYIIKALHDFIAQADCVELCRVSDELFGGKMYVKTLIDKNGNLYKRIYDFEPDGNYMGAFDEFKDD